MGLDGYVGRRHKTGTDPRFVHLFDAHRLDFLSRAYRLTFGIDLSRSMMDRGPGRLRRLSPLLLAWCRIRGERSPISHGAPIPGVEVTSRSTGVTSLHLVHGLLNPVPPSVWLIRAVLREVNRFSAVYLEHASKEFRTLPNLDLDSGLPAPVAIETVDRMVPPTVTSPRPGSAELEPSKPRPRRAA
jgi:hypothetical protein